MSRVRDFVDGLPVRFALALGLGIGGVLAIGAAAAGEAIGQEPPAVEQARPSDADALRATIRRERVKARADVSRAFERGRRSILVQTNTEHLIRMVAIAFGHDPDRAVERAKCESGHAMSPTAGNGQFIGVYQIGTKGRGSMWARAAGDFTSAGILPTDALANILVAHRYAARHGWREWQCGGWSHR